MAPNLLEPTDSNKLSLPPRSETRTDWVLETVPNRFWGLGSPGQGRGFPGKTVPTASRGTRRPSRRFPGSRPPSPNIAGLTSLVRLRRLSTLPDRPTGGDTDWWR